MVKEVTLVELRAQFPADRFLRYDIDTERVVRCAMSPTAWSIRGRSAYWSADWVTVWSYAADSTVVEADVAAHFGWQTAAGESDGVRGVTCNEAIAWPSSQEIEAANDWSWFWTDAESAVGEESAEVFEIDHHDPRLLALLAHSPTASHERDGQRPAMWFGIEQAGELLSVAALKKVGDSYDIQSVVTHTDARGRGLSSTVCSHATTWGLRHAPVVCLGMMSDNSVAERMYTRLGYTCEKRWQSARFAV